MGCLGIVLAALLALAAPASLARASLFGAYAVIAALTVLAVVGVMWRTRQRARVVDSARPGKRRVTLTRIATLAMVYAVVVTLIHTLG